MNTGKATEVITPSAVVAHGENGRGMLYTFMRVHDRTIVAVSAKLTLVLYFR